MPTYVILSTLQNLDDDVERQFLDPDRCRVSDGVWFVRSQRLAGAEVAKDLEIVAGKKSGVVVTAKHYSGVAARDLVEKLSSWEDDER